MNWLMIGALGDLLGAVAVILTLGYLARQIREGSAQDRRRQAMEIANASARHTEAFARDPGLAEIWLRGVRDPRLLDGPEAMRFGSILLGIFHTDEISFHFAREGGLTDYGSTSRTRLMKDILATPGVSAWWAGRRHWFSSEYQAEVDRLVAEGGAGFLAPYDRKQAPEAQAAGG